MKAVEEGFRLPAPKVCIIFGKSQGIPRHFNVFTITTHDRTHAVTIKCYFLFLLEMSLIFRHNIQDCPTAVHNLMLSCWKTKRNERPKFEYITQVMNGWIRSPETLDEDPKDTVMGDWLASIKMGDYTTMFLNAGYVSPCQLTEIGNDDLLKIGVKLIGHRNKILKAIKALSDAKCTRNKTMLIRAESIAV